MLRHSLIAIAIPFVAAMGCAHASIKPSSLLERTDRVPVIKRAQVWEATDVARADMRLGPPDEPRGFAPNQTVACDYVDKAFAGESRKFGCAITHSVPSLSRAVESILASPHAARQ
jgi:hypothetical protein